LAKFKRSGWFIVAVATGINLIGGLLYIWSIIAANLISAYGWSSKQASLPYTAALVAFVIAMAIFGRVLDRRGPRFTATLAVLLMGAGLVLSGLFIHPWWLVFSFGVITGAGTGIMYVSTSTTPAKWFAAEKNGAVTGIVVAGIALATVYYSPLVNALLGAVGLPRTFIFIGIAVPAICGLLAQFMANPPAGYAPPASLSAAAPAQRVPDVTWREMVKTPEFYKLWLMLAFSSSAGLMIFGHAATVARVQVNWNGGYLLVSLLAVFNVLGRLLGGVLSDRVGRLNLMRIVFIVQAINLLLFSRYDTIGLLAFGMALAGLCYGATFPLFPAMVMDLYGKKNLGSNYGLVNTAWGVGGVIGPMIAAAILDASGSYAAAFAAASALLAVSAILSVGFHCPAAILQASQRRA
jgi:MFS family permease